MKNVTKITIMNNKKGGISLAWDNLGFFVLAVLALVVILIIILNIASSGNGFMDLLRGIF